MAEGSFDSVQMRLPDEVVPYADYDYSFINEYSDLDQSYYEVSTGGSYQVSNHVGLFADLAYTDFSDDQPYVYGDQTGNWVSALVGATITL